MLFLVKRRWQTALPVLVLFTALGLTLRYELEQVPPLGLSGWTILTGIAVCGAVLCSDALLHGLFWVTVGEPYRRRYGEMAAVFRGQTLASLLTGAALAGIGEELLFRGLGTSPAYLVSAAVVFGLLHHISRTLWPFTLWAVLEGLLFAAALAVFDALAVTMTAHFLHDCCGFALFRYWNRGRRLRLSAEDR